VNSSDPATVYTEAPSERCSTAGSVMPLFGRASEIDIVAAEAGEEGVTLVFCEVKCRSGLGFGHPLEAITFTKMGTLRQLAALGMREHHVKASAIRLDAIGVVLAPGVPASLTHVRAVG
jgi:putative endonuclease